MAGYEIYFKESFEKDFRAIPKKDLRKILPGESKIERSPVYGVLVFRVSTGWVGAVWAAEPKVRSSIASRSTR